MESASYVLSRMPRELGTFLGLTGQRLTASDLRYLGLSKYQLEDHGFLSQIGEIMLDQKAMHTHLTYGNMFQQQRKDRIKGIKQYLEHSRREMQQRILNKDPEVAEDPRKVMAEVVYRNQKVMEANV
jgi:enoyl-CoA hydratase/carnithine racemase